MFLLVAATTVVVYLQAPLLPYVWDDRTMLVDDPRARDGLTPREIFARDPYAVEGQFSRPLTALTLIPESWLGPRGPLLGHTINLGLHLAVALLLLTELLALGIPRLAATLLALGFSLHPLHSEAVYWVSARGDLIVGLATLLAWHCGRTVTTPWRAAATLGVVSLAALGAKESGVIVPAVACASVWCHQRPRTAAQLLPPAVALVLGIIAFFTWRASTGVALVGRAEALPLTAVSRHWLFEIGQTATWLVSPFDLTVAHDQRSPSPASLALSGGLVVLGAVASVFHWRRHRDARAGLLLSLFVGSLLLVAIAALVTGVESERYAYTPSLLLGLAVVILAQPLATQLAASRRLYARLAVILGAISLVLFGLATFVRAGAWSSEQALFEQAYAADPTSAEAASLLAHHRAFRDHRLDLALPLYEQRVTARPDDVRAWTNLSACLISVRRFDDAARAAERALALEPGRPAALRNLDKARALSAAADRPVAAPAR